MAEKHIEAVARSLVGSVPGMVLTETQLAAAEEFTATLVARGFAVIPKSDADHLARVRRKSGGVHPNTPGQWSATTENGWVGLRAGRYYKNIERGMFSPDEAREIALSLIVFADQEENRR